MSLSTVGELSYNGVVFAETFHTTINSKPVPSTDDRTIKYIEYTISVVGMVSASSDATLNTMRNLLQRKGGVLRFTQRGFGGPVNVNEMGVWDVKNGPQTTLGLFRPMPQAPQGTTAAYVEWTVTTNIPACPPKTPPKYEFGLMELCYTIEYVLDEQGLATVTVNGDLEIPLSGAPLRRFIDNADAYREKLNYPIIDGYNRERQSFALSGDRRTLTFMFVDKQLPSPRPPGCTMCDLEESVNSSLAASFRRWDITFSATMRMEPTQSQGNSYLQFMAFVLSRLQTLNRISEISRPRIAQPRPIAFRAADRPMSLETRISITFMSQGPSLTNILVASGLWKPLPFTHHAWNKSLQNNAHHIRGTGRLRYNQATDSIVDLCTPMKSQPLKQPSTTPVKADRPVRASSVPPFAGPGPLTIPQPRGTTPGGDTPGDTPTLPDLPDGSPLPAALFNPIQGPRRTPTVRTNSTTFDDGDDWLDFKMRLGIRQKHRVKRHKPLKGKVQQVPPLLNILGPASQLTSPVRSGGSAFSPAGGVGSSGSGQAANEAQFTTTADTPDIFQTVSSPDVTVILSGSATRFDAPINPPRLVTIEGQTPTLVNEWIDGGAVGTIGNSVVYHLAWVFEYVVPLPLKRHHTPMNPFLGVNGDNSR